MVGEVARKVWDGDGDSGREQLMRNIAADAKMWKPPSREAAERIGGFARGGTCGSSILGGFARLDARQFARGPKACRVGERPSERNVCRTNDVSLTAFAPERQCGDDSGPYAQSKTLVDSVTEDEGLGVTRLDLGPKGSGASGPKAGMHPDGVPRKDDHSPFVQKRKRVELA